MKNKITNLIKKIKINEKTINYVLIFVLGFLVGVAAKTEAKKRVTIGYGDYLVNGMKQGFDLNRPEPIQASQNQAEPEAPAEQPTDANESANQ
jgi:hypothetical protein